VMELRAKRIATTAPQRPRRVLAPALVFALVASSWYLRTSALCGDGQLDDLIEKCDASNAPVRAEARARDSAPWEQADQGHE